MNIYLAGSFFPIGEYKDWREKLKVEAPYHSYLDPLDNDQFSIKTFTEQDLEAITKKADLSFTYFSKNKPRGQGSSAEAGIARASNVPIMLVDEKNILYPFLVGLSTYVLTDLVLGVQLLKEIDHLKNLDEKIRSYQYRLAMSNKTPITTEIKVNNELYAVTKIREGQSSFKVKHRFEYFFNRHKSHILLDENKILNKDLIQMSKRVFTNEEAFDFYLSELKKGDEFKAIYKVMAEFPN